MKQLFVMAVALVMISACVIAQPVPPGQDKGCGYGPGNSGSAPGQVKKNCR